jgi:hypothetical protein
MTIIKEVTGYSAFTRVKNDLIATQGNNFEELKKNILEAVNLNFENTGFVYTIEEIGFKFDIETFFDFYKVINAKALSKRIGMNQSLLAQYIKGIKKPSSSQTKRILAGIKEIGKELCEVDLAV